MSAFLFFYMSMWLMCSCFIALSCNDVGIILLLPLRAIPSMIATSSLHEQYSCSSFSISVIGDGKAWSMSSTNALRCSSSRATCLFSSTAMQSGMSMHDTIAVMVMHMPNISSSPFVSWLCLDSQSVMNRCGLAYLVFWFCISVSTEVFFEACVINMNHFS